MNKDQISKFISEAERSVKAVWEIDGITIYVKDMKLENDGVVVDWFCFDETIDKSEMSGKVEDLARKIIGEKECTTLLSRILSTMRNTFARSTCI